MEKNEMKEETAGSEEGRAEAVDELQRPVQQDAGQAGEPKEADAADAADAAVEPAEPVGANAAASPAAAAPNPMNMKVVGAIVAVVVVVLLVVLVRMFACSAATPNLVDLTTKPSSEVAATLKSEKEVDIQGYKVYTNNEEFATALQAEASGERPDVKKYDGSYLMMVGEDSSILSLEDINNGADPTRVSLAQVVSAGSLTAKDVADRVAKMAPYEHVYVVAITENDFFSGSAMGDGCVTEFSVMRYDDSWLLTVNTYSIEEDASGASKADSFNSAFESINPENYADCYQA